MYDPVEEALELREQLASPRRKVGFFLGAGTSMAAGLEGIRELTEGVRVALSPDLQPLYDSVKSSVEHGTVEDILSRVRVYRELLRGTERKLDGFDETSAKALDIAICQAIAGSVNNPPPNGLEAHHTYVEWCRLALREQTTEIFTTNYDLLLENAFEDIGIPFFDGFVGAVNPFFVPESVDADGTDLDSDYYPPGSWIRLWKLHGSIGWRILTDPRGTRVVRFGNNTGTGELLIYPSRDKYADSRKLPFITFMDRLRRFLMIGETTLVVMGYSFGDQHLNEILYQGLRSNRRLNVVALQFDSMSEELKRASRTYHNLSVYSADLASVGGVIGGWDQPKKQVDWSVWDPDNKTFTLGDFRIFARFLERGFRLGAIYLNPPAASEEGGDQHAEG